MNNKIHAAICEKMTIIESSKNTTLLSLVNSVSRRNVTDNDKIGFIKVLLLKTILMVVMYEMRDTNIYQKGVKKAGNEFLRELGKNLFEDEYTNLLGTDACAVEELEKNIELLANQISKSDLGCFSVVVAVLEKYQIEPDYVIDRLNIIKGDSEDIQLLTRREDLVNRINKLPGGTISQIEKYIEGLENIYLN